MNTLDKLRKKEDLPSEEAEALLVSVMRGELSHEETKEMLLALKEKGETTDEIVGFVTAMRRNMLSVDAPGAMDIVGTGGDNSGTFNISTASALVVAGAGVSVAKHGNRAASSKCGSADVLEALGVNLTLTPEQAGQVLKEVGFVFMLAPLYHPAMKAVGAARKELKTRTVFNLLGPFANPASTKRQLTGVPDMAAAEMMAKAAERLGYERVIIVTSEDGMDEISLSAPTHALDVTPAGVTRFTIDPQALGFEAASKEAILGASAEENAAIIKGILNGEKGAKRDIVVLNGAFALLAGGKVGTAEDGIALAQKSLDSGAAKGILEKLVVETGKFK